MAPKNKFTRDQIVDVAFNIAKVHGINSITIRKVADGLGSSIAPIYVNFKDVDELIGAVIKKIYSVSNQLVQEQNTGSPFYDIGLASLKFAKDYSVLFRDLLLQSNDYMKDYDQELGSNLIEEIKKDPDLAGFTDEEIMGIFLKMRIFQLGLSVMLANNLLPGDFDEVKAMELLESAATDVIRSTRISNENINV